MRPTPVPEPPTVKDQDSEILELDPEDAIELPDNEFPRDAMPAGLGYWLHQWWSRARPQLALALAALTLGGAALARSWAALARSCSRLQLGRRAAIWWRRMWPGWPTSWRQLLVMATVMFVLGCVLVLPFALAQRTPAPVALARVTAPASPASSPNPAAESDPEAPPRAARTRELPRRTDVARQLARESFEKGAPLDGVSYFRIAMRTERRTEDDDVLILYTIAALSHHEAAAAAERLLRELGSEARPLLAATAQGHPDKRVQARARSLIAHRRR